MATFLNSLPNEHLIVVVRDGRSVVESGMRSFNWNFEKATRAWNEEVKELVHFMKNRELEGGEGKFLVVKFEDLMNDSEGLLKEIFHFLGLDSDEFDFEYAKNLPVSGSSDLKSQEGQKVNWNFKEKKEGFNPLNRFEKWSRKQHERFNYLAEESLAAFGYEAKTYGEDSVRWRYWNWAMDLYWQVKRFRMWLSRKVKG